MAIKKRSDIERQNTFIETGQLTPSKPSKPLAVRKDEEWRIADWSPASLKKLSIKELERRWTDIEDQLEAIDDQAKMMLWFICLRVREEYPGDKEMGQYLAGLAERNPKHALVTRVSQQSRNRWANAARWCEEMKIVSLHEAGLNQKAVFILSAPGNRDYSEKVFQKVKGSHVPATEIERMINQAKSVATIEKQPPAPQLEKMSYGGDLEPYVSEGSYQKRIPVVNGVAQESAAPVEAEEGDWREVKDDEQAGESSKSDLAEVAESAASAGQSNSVALKDADLPEDQCKKALRVELINQMAAMDYSLLSDDEILAEWAALEKSYGRTVRQLIELYKKRAQVLSDSRYGR